MRVSVVVCTHTMDRYDDVCDAAESVFAQTHDDVELVVVSDGEERVAETFRTEYGHREDLVVHCNEENSGVSVSRNNGVERSTGDIVAFLDDDAIADPDWVEQLLFVYEEKDVPAVGGRMTPEWMTGKPSYLPEEFYWLIGVTHPGFGPDGDPERAGEVRNTWGSNLSFRREVFEQLGGFEKQIKGRTGGKNLQSEEPELCARLERETGHGVYYNPDATVRHKVYEYRKDPGWLVDRAFWQGYSKRGMAVLVPESTGDESDFLGTLLTERLPMRFRGLVRSPSVAAVLQLVFLFVLTGAVGLGYLYGMTVWG